MMTSAAACKYILVTIQPKTRMEASSLFFPPSLKENEPHLPLSSMIIKKKLHDGRYTVHFAFLQANPSQFTSIHTWNWDKVNKYIMRELGSIVTHQRFICTIALIQTKVQNAWGWSETNPPPHELGWAINQHGNQILYLRERAGDQEVNGGTPCEASPPTGYSLRKKNSARCIFA